MELKEIQDLIKFVAKSGVSEVELESKGFKIVIKTGGGQENGRHEQTYIAAPMPVMAPQVQMQVPVSAPTNEAPKAAPVASPAVVESANLITIKSPMVGTFYRSSSPDKDPYVKIGDNVGKGSVLCIIEAMKLFNEIESEYSGQIVKILADDMSPVAYDQPLFLIKQA